VRPGRVIITVTGIRPNSVRRLMPLRGRNPSSSFATDESPHERTIGHPWTWRSGNSKGCGNDHWPALGVRRISRMVTGGASGVQSLRGVARTDGARHQDSPRRNVDSRAG
jgi:hypothetical protein